MLEFLRKHQYGLMLVVAILTIIAFVFLYDKNTYGQGNGQKGTAFKIYGKGYDSNHLRKLDSYQILATRLGMYQLAYGELRGTRVVDGVPVDFPLNLIIIRKEGRKLGISPSDDDVRKEVESMPIFSDPNTRRYDPARFTEISKNLLAQNYKDSDIVQIVKDKITLDKIKELLAANIQPPVTEIDDAYAARNEKITAYALKRSLDDFLKAVTVTDEEIKTRYDEEQESLLTEEKRRIEYVHFQAPVFPKSVAPANPFPKDSGFTFPNSPDFDPTSLIQPKKPTVDIKPEKTPEPPKVESGTTPAAPGEETAAPESTESPAPTDKTPGSEVPAAVEESATTEVPAAVEEAPNPDPPSTTEEEDPCGAPQDEAVTADTVENAAEPVADADVGEAAGAAVGEEVGEAAGEEVGEAVGEEVGEAVGEAAGAAAGEEVGEANDLAEKVAEALKKAGEGAADPKVPTPTPGLPNVVKSLVTPPRPATAAEKEAAKVEFFRAAKATIDPVLEAAYKSKQPVDLQALGKDFLAVSADKKFTATYATTELFTREDAPAFIKDATSSGRAPIDLVFNGKKDALSETIKLVIDEREDWLLFRVTEIVEPKELSLEESKERITKKLKDEKAEKALLEAIQADADQIKAEMAGKNSFKASADKLKIEYARHFKFNGSPPLAEIGNFKAYEDLIKNTVPGTFSEPIVAGDKAFLVYVAAKDIEDEPAVAKNKKLTIASQLGGSRSAYGSQIFQAWLARAYEKAEPSRNF